MTQSNFDNKLPLDLLQAFRVKEPEFLGVEQIIVRGYDFETSNTSDGKVDFDKMLSEYFLTTGLQSTTFARAIEQINKMIDRKLLAKMTSEDLNKQKSIPMEREPTPCTIFLSYTSNLVTSGLREVIRYLVKNNMVDCLVTTAGGIEEDFVKCLAPTFVGAFNISGHDLFRRSVYRAGNMLLPCKNYTLFENWLVPILDQMLAEEKETGQAWTPSRIIHRLGKEINNEESIYYWAYKNNIPVFSPGITDGAIGDNLFLHSFKHDGRTITVDVAQDVRLIMFQALRAVSSGVIVLGGGLPKHHILNANSMRGGADYAVYVNTANEFDGCDSGALPDEAFTWGKISLDASPVKLFAEASLVLPLIVSQTFFKKEKDFKNKNDH